MNFHTHDKQVISSHDKRTYVSNCPALRTRTACREPVSDTAESPPCTADPRSHLLDFHNTGRAKCTFLRRTYTWTTWVSETVGCICQRLGCLPKTPADSHRHAAEGCRCWKRLRCNQYRVMLKSTSMHITVCIFLRYLLLILNPV